MSGKMYEKRPEEDARYHDTWRLLKKYRDVTWSLELSIRQVKNQFRIDYDCSIEDFLESTYMAGADLGGTDIENHARCIERSYKMLTLLENSVNLLRTHHQSGEVYYWILYYSFLSPQKLKNVEEIIEALHPHIIGEVYQLIAASSEQELNALFGVLPVTHPAKAPYSIFKQASEGVRGGVIIGLGSRLQVFQNKDIRNITSYNEIDLELPGKQPCAYYCITSDQDSTFDFLSSLFLSFVFIRLVRYADEHCPGGELPVPVHVLGEELCACGVIPDLSRKISVIRSRNLSMSCVFQNLAGLQNRYPYNQWQEILGNCDVQLFLGCTDALTAEFISDRTGEASISVTSKAKQLGTWRVSNYTPEYRETSGVGRRKLMTMDEVLRMDIDKALILIRGKNVLEVDKYDYSKHPEAKKLRPSKAASHVPAWRANQPQEKQTPSAPPSQAAEKKLAQKKKPAPAEKVVAVPRRSRCSFFRSTPESASP